MVKIRLQRAGKKKAPFYHIVVADSRSPRDGKIIEQIGTYNPMIEPSELKLDREKVAEWIKNGAKPKEFTYYKDYSIGFLTRGCFRQCQFCVNKHYKKCVKHSNITEFMDKDRPKLCFLDDNFFACPN